MTKTKMRSADTITEADRKIAASSYKLVNKAFTGGLTGTQELERMIIFVLLKDHFYRITVQIKSIIRRLFQKLW